MHTLTDRLLHVPEHDIYHDLHELVKIYPDRIRLVLFKNVNRVRKAGYEDSLPIAHASKNTIVSTPTLEDSLVRSLRRSRQLISDVVMCNDFDLFCTFTFKADRQNPDLCKQKMSTWLKNQKRIHGAFKYLIVPEFHKDRQSLHFHALFQGYAGRLTDSGKIINGRTAYNLKGYRLGFNSAVVIDDREKVSSYVRKYITKDMPSFSGKKRFWLSTGLNRPVTVQNGNFIHNELYNWSEIHNNELFTLFESRETFSLPS